MWLVPKLCCSVFLDGIFKTRSQPNRKGKLLEGLVLDDFGWSDTERTAFSAIKHALHHAIWMAVPAPNTQLCLFTDASIEGCSIIIVTQVDPAALDKPVMDQRHQIVLVTSHRWTDAQRRWHVSSLEAYPIIFALQRLDWLFQGRVSKSSWTIATWLFFNPDSTSPVLALK